VKSETINKKTAKELPIVSPFTVHLSHKSPDKFHDECAVFGIYGHKEAANLTYLGLYALQHRGQEASGIVSGDGSQFYVHKGQGIFIIPRRSIN
jgi:hypothetical protein